VRQAGVVLVQPIYDRGAVATKKQLREQTNLAQTQFGQSRQDLALRVAEAYFGVVLGEETLRVVQAEKAALQQQRDRAKARFDIGQGKITDLHEAQARLDGVGSREVTAQSALEQRRTRFQEIVGTSPDQLSGLAARFAPGRPSRTILRRGRPRGKNRASSSRPGSRNSTLQAPRSTSTVSPVAQPSRSWRDTTRKGKPAIWRPGWLPIRAPRPWGWVNIPLYAGGAWTRASGSPLRRRARPSRSLLRPVAMCA
jgi:outer membrane protein